MIKQDNVVYIYSDGACSGNPGAGGYGAIMLYNGTKKEISGFQANATNNQMELMAVIESLKVLKRKCKIVITTDSVYVQKGITDWIFKWHKNGFKSADKKPIKNQNLWLELDALSKQHDITWLWVKGHNGHEYNEAADVLARNAIELNT